MKLKASRFFVLIILVIVLSLSGCNKVESVLSAGPYALSRDGIDVMTITFDLSENRFSFWLPKITDAFMEGTIEMDNETVTATTANGIFTYVFKIEDNDTISFLQNSSDDLVWTSANEDYALEDGTEFILSAVDDSNSVS